MKLVRVATLPLALLAVSCAATEDPSPALGSRTEAILNGHPATADEAWGTVGLEASAPGAAWSCTGTLIAPRVIVTAAHCVMDDYGTGLAAENLEIIAGASDLYAATPQQRFTVEKSVAHERAFRGTGPIEESGLGQDNDIGVIVTQKAVLGVTPVPLFPLERMDELLKEGTQLVIAGYGVRTLAELDDPEALTLHYVGSASYVRRSDYEFLAGKGEVESDTCVGDSGGPVYATVDGVVTLLGATSRGRDDADVDCGAGGIYTLVPAYKDWLAEHAGDALDETDGDGTGDGTGDGDDGASDGDADGADGAEGDSDAGVVTPPKARKKEGGCTLSPGAAPGSAAWLALFVGLGLVVRRVKSRA